jgi:hypothetical protein
MAGIMRTRAAQMARTDGCEKQCWRVRPIVRNACMIAT